MKTPIFICTLIIIIFFNTNHVFGQRKSHFKKVKKKEFSTILDSANVTGSILILDYYSRAYYSNNFKHCKQGYLPASTFKIVNSIIGLETGVIENENTIFKWDEKPRSYKI
jgi:beta-lactamase class D